MNAMGLALAAAVMWGVTAFMEKVGLKTADPMSGILARAVGVFLGGAAFALFLPRTVGGLFGMGWRSFACLAGAGLLGSVLGQIFYYRALKAGSIGPVTALAGAWPVVAFILGIVFLRDAPTLKTVFGVALVVAGVALLK